MNNFYLRIVLTSFFGARVQEVENEEGVMEKCVCIPIDRNDLKINPKNQNVSAYFFMTECTTANIYGWTHYLKMKTSIAFKRLTDSLGMEIPYAGNARKGNYITKNGMMYKNKCFVKKSDI